MLTSAGRPFFPFCVQDVDEALKRIPQEVLDQRNQRLKVGGRPRVWGSWREIDRGRGPWREIDRCRGPCERCWAVARHRRGIHRGRAVAAVWEVGGRGGAARPLRCHDGAPSTSALCPPPDVLQRAIDLNMKHSELSKDLQQLQTPYQFYLKDTLDVSDTYPPACLVTAPAARCILQPLQPAAAAGVIGGAALPRPAAAFAAAADFAAAAAVPAAAAAAAPSGRWSRLLLLPLAAAAPCCWCWRWTPSLHPSIPLQSAVH